MHESMNKKVRILTIDGGGIRGIIPARILLYMEEQLQELVGEDARISDYFDLMAGTSSGGILVCTYLLPDENGRPKLTAQDSLDLYREHGIEIFGSTLFERFKRGFGYIDERYSSEGLERVLKAYFGDLMLSELIKPCMITAYNLVKRRAFFFGSFKASRNKNKDFMVRDVARATSAAPTYFEPALIYSKTGKKFELIDGGVFANNPALCAYSEAVQTDFGEMLKNPEKPNKPTSNDILLVSLGTGNSIQPYYHADLKDKGYAGWMRPLIDILRSSNSETVNYQLKLIFDCLKNRDDHGNYYRLECPLPKTVFAEMDRATPSNVEALEQVALDSIYNNSKMLDEIVQKLIDND